MITIGSNGIDQMIRAAGKSSYRTPRMAWWGWVAFGMALAFLGMSACHASPSCMTYTEARATWPTKYLHWHGEHCWSDTRGTSHTERRHVERVPTPRARPDIPGQDWIYSDRWWLS